MLTNDTHPSSSAVRLIGRHGNVPSGALGHVIGRFARENPTYLVNFRKDGILELRGDEIAADRRLTRSDAYPASRSRRAPRR